MSRSIGSSTPRSAAPRTTTGGTTCRGGKSKRGWRGRRRRELGGSHRGAGLHRCAPRLHRQAPTARSLGSRSDAVCQVWSGSSKSSHERHSHLLCMSRQPSKAAEPVMKSLLNSPVHCLPLCVAAITFDNVAEFAYHDQLHTLSMRTFFCDAHAPWQKGDIENTIGRMRRGLPRKPTSLRSPMTACSVWFARIITHQESVVTAKPRPRSSLVTCCASNVDPPSRVRGNDESTRRGRDGNHFHRYRSAQAHGYSW